MAQLDCIIKRRACSFRECGSQSQPSRETSRDVAKERLNSKNKQQQQWNMPWGMHRNLRFDAKTVEIEEELAWLYGFPHRWHKEQRLVIYSKYWSLILFTFFLGHSFLLEGTLSIISWCFLSSSNSVLIYLSPSMYKYHRYFDFKRVRMYSCEAWRPRLFFKMGEMLLIAKIL